MSDLALAQFVEQRENMGELPKQLQSTRKLTLGHLRSLPVHRSNKLVLSSIDLPSVSSQFSAPLGSIQPRFTKDPRASYAVLPESMELLSDKDTSYSCADQVTPLMHVADLMWNTGLVITIPKNTRTTEPFIIPNLSSEKSWPLIRVIVGPSCDITLIEEHSHALSNNAIAAHTTEVIVREGSSVNMMSISPSVIRGGAGGVLPPLYSGGVRGGSLGVTRIHLFRDSKLKFLTALFGTTGRVETLIVAHEPGVDIDERTLHLTTENEKLYLVSQVVHDAPSSKSRLTVRGALGGTSYVRYEGKIKITKGSQLTDAGLDEKTLFLSDKAKHDSVPGLEIDADDVKATHASSVSKVDEEQLFYAQSRGLTKKEAQFLIIDGMLRSLTDSMPDHIVQRIDSELTTRLHAFTE